MSMLVRVSGYPSFATGTPRNKHIFVKGQTNWKLDTFYTIISMVCAVRFYHPEV